MFAEVLAQPHLSLITRRADHELEHIASVLDHKVFVDGRSELDDVLKAVMAQGGTIHACDRIEPDIEEAFSRLLAEETAKGRA